ncbi:protein FAM53B [Chanos chanos]|uniref:Protein FAM53B n=1 Tax=Chanos chanos TaxID=29144 RepID=A0A6J2VHQ9_CHACN|nr:protein FAM53B [Chanos chanos]XP_030631453.1 protein FAM53B [Chanos chanos]
MCVAMVIIQTKTLEKKGVDDVTSKESNLELRSPSLKTMSQGTTLFTYTGMETGLWRDVGRGCGGHQRPVGSSLESLWDGFPEAAGAAGSISGLLRDLSLSETSSAGVAAPPSKRQCRSHSCSEELASCRSSWRPQGSRVWTTVEKRRCHSGGSVQRGGSLGTSFAQIGFPAMQRSSSFSLPTRSNVLELPSFGQGIPFPPFTGQVTSPCSEPPRPLYLSDEQICLPEPRGPSEASSPDSTPELDRRTGQGGLARSRSQPCVLNDKKIGMKRRRPADTHKQRPSLDLAKMTQKLPNFHSLSCPGITSDDGCQSSHTRPTFDSADRLDFSSVCDQGTEPHLDTEEEQGTSEESVIDEQEGDISSYSDLMPGTANGKEREQLWAGLCGTRRDVYQLGGELDIEQIERN